jgi:type IV pilus assembly protein PilC
MNNFKNLFKSSATAATATDSTVKVKVAAASPTPQPGPVQPDAAPVQKAATKRFLGMPLQEQILFAKRLAILIKAGVPILSALHMLKKQAHSKNAIYIMERLHAQVENGAYLSSGMAQFKKIFGEFAINIVRVGEISGTLNENLNYLAEELKKKQELRRKIVSALVYPIFIVIATIGVIILLTAYVFPKIMPIFQSFKFQLPWTTKTLIFISNTFIHYGLYIFLGVLLLVGAAILALTKYKIRLWVHKNSLRVPLLGPMFRSYHIANFTRTLGLLLKSDVRIVEALKIVASTTGNLAYKEEFATMAENVTRGERLAGYMEKDTKMFPSMLSQMISVGEATGGLTSTLMFLAEMYEDDLNTATKNLSTSIEPVLMIFMGLLVGFIALSIITPIYGVTQNIHP